VRAGIECIESPDERVPLVLGGGTAKASSQAQLRANVLDRAVEAPSDADVTLAGAAMLAATGCGLYDTLETAWGAMRSPVELYEPDRERASAYDEVFDRWRAARRNLPATKEDG
jgi:sugar (pentulose or hexulose) kinase